MNTLTNYKPIALVFYIDGNGQRMALPLDEEKREAFKKAVETHKMVELDGIVINTFDIKEIRPANKITDIEMCFYSKSWHQRAFLNQRAKRMSENKYMSAVEYFSAMPDKKFALRRMNEMVEYFDKEHLSNN